MSIASGLELKHQLPILWYFICFNLLQYVSICCCLVHALIPQPRCSLHDSCIHLFLIILSLTTLTTSIPILALVRKLVHIAVESLGPELIIRKHLRQLLALLLRWLLVTTLAQHRLSSLERTLPILHHAILVADLAVAVLLRAALLHRALDLAADLLELLFLSGVDFKALGDFLEEFWEELVFQEARVVGDGGFAFVLTADFLLEVFQQAFGLVAEGVGDAGAAVGDRGGCGGGDEGGEVKVELHFGGGVEYFVFLE